MNAPASPKVHRFFLRVLHLRVWIVAAFLVLTVAGIYGATRIPNDPAIDRLVVSGDPVARATIDFDRLFPEGDQALIMLEGADPLSPEALRTADQLEHQLAKIPGVKAHSLVDFFRRADPKADISASEAERLRPFATGTPLFRRAGLLGDHYLGIGLELRVSSPEDRNRALAAIDSLAMPLEKPGGPLPRFGASDLLGSMPGSRQQTGVATKKFMPLFGIFLVALVLIVYRSLRALAAIILTLGSVVAIAVGLAAIFGWSNTVVSTLVPLTVMVTTTATLVYIHSRYMEPDDAPTPLEHHAGALANKFLPMYRIDVRDRGRFRRPGRFRDTAGARDGFVDRLRPHRGLGGLLHAVSSAAVAVTHTVAGRRYSRGTAICALRRLLGSSNGPLSLGVYCRSALVLMFSGAAALFGVPGKLAPLALETDALTYVNPSERVAQDTRRFQEFNGLDVVDLWIKTPPGHALDPEFLRAIEQLTQQLGARLSNHSG